MTTNVDEVGVNPRCPATVKSDLYTHLFNPEEGI